MVKVGTGVVAEADGQLALGRLGALVAQICALRAAGREVLLVSSGAVGLGAQRLGLARPPQDVVDRQACAAAGQGALMAFYDQLFGQLGVRCAQVLLTEDDLSVRRRHVNLVATLDRLLALGAVPILNENDAVSTAEVALRGARVFGDNDRLSVLVASAVGADALVLLTDVDAVYDRSPREPGATRIATFTPGTSVALGAGSALGRGGMGAKIAAAQLGASVGVQVVVAGGQVPDVVRRAAEGDDLGTWFPAGEAPKALRRWLTCSSAPEGRLVVDAGARRALVDDQASLLLPGIRAVEGAFDADAVVSLCTDDGEEFARGRVARAADELRRALQDHDAGARTRAVVHRDHVVILDGTVDADLMLPAFLPSES